jgi:salicylate hydroxylase
LRPFDRQTIIAPGQHASAFFMARVTQEMIHNGQPITVIGAGVAGLAAARALALRGAAVTVLEQAVVVTDIGAGIQISPNGAAVINALGLGPALVANSLQAERVTLRDGLTDTTVLSMNLTGDPTGRGFHLVHRADLVTLLRDGAIAAGVDIRLNQKIDRVDLSGPDPVLHLIDGTAQSAPVLIGADGLHSQVRTALNGTETPFFTHQVAWRATIPNTSPNVPLVEVHMGPGRHLVSYPLRYGTQRNIVAVEERGGWAAESWSLQDDPVNLQRAFASFSPKVRGWLGQVERPNLWGLFRHPVAEVWHKTTSQGGAAILGDAAHPSLPFLAQGANMALEDAWCLARSIADHTTLDTAFAAYQAARKPRTAAIVAAANTNARAYHLSGVARQIAHLGLRVGGRMAPNFALGRFDWIYHHDVTLGQNPRTT